MEECHRRVGRVGPEHRSSRRGRGEQRRPLRRRVGNMGACPPPLRGRSAVCRPKRRISLWRAKDRLACRFRLDGSMEASRLHAAVKSAPVCGDHSAHRRDRRAFQSQFFARNPRLVDFGALSTPYCCASIWVKFSKRCSTSSRHRQKSLSSPAASGPAGGEEKILPSSAL